MCKEVIPTVITDNPVLEHARLQAEYWEEDRRGTAMSVRERYERALDQLRPEVQRTHQPRPLGEVLAEMGLVTPKQVSEALEAQQAGRRSRLLGEILVEQGVLAPKDIHRALQRQLGPQGES